ncbi:MAG: hypothetical protein MHM6MM_004074 [Cercozoa sp. M6MM]
MNSEDQRKRHPLACIEKILRQKILDSQYWKEHCFALSSATILDKAVALSYVGGGYGGMRRPAPFVCLLAKMLQLQPSKDIVQTMLLAEDLKYVRVLGAFYVRIAMSSEDVFEMLTPLLRDYRRVRLRNPDGSFTLKHIDELAYELLTENYVMELTMKRLPELPREIFDQSPMRQHESVGDLSREIESLRQEVDKLQKRALEQEKRQGRRRETSTAHQLTSFQAQSASSSSRSSRRKRSDRCRDDDEDLFNS